ncbi:hypothetical protein [Denitratisoma oestradiolicum]|nr:hypothetical protein [Denitratisoma oestradiolicum]
MSVMCKMGEACTHSSKMCLHEKMMAVMVMLAIGAAIAHWVLHLF